MIPVYTRDVSGPGSVDLRGAIFQYEPGDITQDLLVGQWFGVLTMTGEIATTFARSLHGLATFLSYFVTTATLYYKIDSGGIWAALWTEPILSGCSIGLWVRKGYRQSHEGLTSVEELCGHVLNTVPVIIGVTKYERLARSYESFGCQVLGRIPQIFDYQGAWIVYLTREGFEQARQRRHERRRRESEVVA